MFPYGRGDYILFKNKKLLSSLLTLAIMASTFVIPVGVSAKTTTMTDNLLKFEQKKKSIEYLRTVQKNRKDRIQVSKKASDQMVRNHIGESPTTSKVTGKSLSYSGTLKQAIHTYVFTLGKGTYVTLTQSGTDNVLWTIYDQELDIVHTSPMGNTVTGLTAGKKYFVDVFDDESFDVQQNYTLTVSGTLLTGDTTLPTLHLSNPTSYNIELPYGTKSLAIKGTHTGNRAILQYYGREFSLGSSFHQNISVFGGGNGYEIMVSEVSGNVINQMGYMFVKDFKRFAGLDRYKTAIAISQNRFPEADMTDTVIIARGDHFADAVAGGPLAYLLGGPLLFTQPTKLTDTTKVELQRLKPKKAIILGSVDAVSTTAENTIKGLGISVERFASKNRFETAVKVADFFVKTANDYGVTVDSALITNGMGFADPLSASGVGGAYTMPILTAPANYLDNSTYDYLRGNRTIRNFFVIGNTNSIQKEVIDKLVTLGNATIDRTGGSNSYQVNANVGHKFFPSVTAQALVVANGDNFPDGLAIAPMANAYGGPLLLTTKSSLHADIRNYIKLTKPLGIFISGDASVVSDAIQAELIKKLQ